MALQNKAPEPLVNVRSAASLSSGACTSDVDSSDSDPGSPTVPLKARRRPRGVLTLSIPESGSPTSWDSVGSQSSPSASFLRQSPSATNMTGSRLRMRRSSESVIWNSNRDDAPSEHAQSVGILVHGCHLSADNWERIVWGQPPTEMGRLPHAVLLAWKKQAHVVVFGTGASEKDGLKESEYTLKYLWEHWYDLAQFEQLQHVPLGQALKLMRSISVLDTETQNTDQEVIAALRVFQAKACQQALLVSSPTHLPRCLACACKVMEQDPALFKGGVFASACDTCYDQSSAQDVIVVEPPHRGDRDKSLDDLKFHDLVKRCYKVPAEQKRWFFERIDNLLQDCSV